MLCICTEWKLVDFSVFQILRQINLDILEILKQLFCNFRGSELCGECQPPKVEIFGISKCVHIIDFALQESPKLISRKI